MESNRFQAERFQEVSQRLAHDGFIGIRMITIELYGVPRMRAGIDRLNVDAASVGEALRTLARECPALAGSILDGGRVHRAYKLSLNGDRFVSDPDTQLSEGDSLLLLAADVGG